MARENQPKNRKSVSKKDASEIKKLTPQEIAFINRTTPPLPAEQRQPDADLEKSCNTLFEMFLEKLVIFIEMYAGFYSRVKIMDMFGVTKNTLNVWIKEKGLPFYQVDKKILIKKSDVEEFLRKYRKIMPVFVFYLPDVLDAAALMAA